MPRLAPNVAPKIAWSFEPSVLIGVAALAILYLIAWRRGRATGSPHRPGFGRLAVFTCGLLAILAALVSPLDGLGDQLLVMHMIQHILLLDIVPILLILGLNKVLLRPVTRRLHSIEQRAGYLAHPAFAVLAVRRLHVGLAHPGDVRRRAAQQLRPRVRAPVLRGRRDAVLVAHHVADPQPDAARRARAGRPT